MAVCRSGKDWLGGSCLGIMVQEMSASDHVEQLQAKCCKNNLLPHTIECRPLQMYSAASTFVSTNRSPPVQSVGTAGPQSRAACWTLKP